VWSRNEYEKAVAMKKVQLQKAIQNGEDLKVVHLVALKGRPRRHLVKFRFARRPKVLSKKQRTEMQERSNWFGGYPHQYVGPWILRMIT
jgi:hypothetical protein